MIRAADVELQIANRPLLRDLNFGISRGELIAILGPNGIGKTTLLRAMNGLHPLSGGAIEIDGRPVETYSAAQRAQRVAMMVTEEVPLETMTVREAVAAGRYPYHHWWEWRERDEDRAAIEAALAAVAMLDFMNRDFSSLSTGERQRVWLAAGLAQATAILLLDEPTSHLDIRISHEILQLLRLQAKAGKTVVCVLHDMNEALEFADRIMVLGQGTLLGLQSPQAIVGSGVLDAAYGITFEPVQTPTGAIRVFAL